MKAETEKELKISLTLKRYFLYSWEIQFMQQDLQHLCFRQD